MRRVGLAAFEDRKNAYEDVSTNILKTQVDQLKTQLSVFQSALNYFAVEHGEEIRTNAQFRKEFASMCTAIGVDPLASSASNRGSMWATLLGKDVNDFYFELAVKIIEICRQTRDANGGLIYVSEVRSRLADRSQLRPLEVSEDDIERAVESCRVLGKGFEVVDIGASRKLIRSAPSELSTDHSTVLTACQALGYVSVALLRDNLGWTPVRAGTCLDEMVSAGYMWVDAQGPETAYWIPESIW
ncbi:vacuolar-sorting protein Snf8p [Trichomonascus vanleenenianus]|uniref:ESCRT-II subunit protein SNF8 n=1 Tax=Trichomonascus vanleenenianus TaxID=2268995 RepID=UPI003ECB3BAA